MSKKWVELLFSNSVMGGEGHEEKREILLDATEFIKKIYTESGIKKLNKLENCNDDVFRYLLTKENVSNLYETLQKGLALQGPDIVELIEILAKSSKVEMLICDDSVKVYNALGLDRGSLLDLITKLSELETDVIKMLLSEKACDFYRLNIVNIYDFLSISGDKDTTIRNFLSQDIGDIQRLSKFSSVETLLGYCDDVRLINILTSKEVHENSKEVHENSEIDLKLLKEEAAKDIKLLASEELQKAMASMELKNISMELHDVLFNKGARIGYEKKYFTADQLIEISNAEDGKNMVSLLVSKQIRHLYHKGETVESLAKLEAIKQIASYGRVFRAHSLVPELFLSVGAIALYNDGSFNASSLRALVYNKMSRDDINEIVSEIKNHKTDESRAKLREALFSKNALLGYLKGYFKPTDLDIKTNSGGKNYYYAHVQILTSDAAMKLYEDESLNIEQAVKMLQEYMSDLFEIDQYQSPQIHNVIFSHNVIDLCFKEENKPYFVLSDIKTVASSLSEAFSGNENILKSFINNDEIAKALQSKEALIAYAKYVCTPAELYKIGNPALVPDLINVLTKIGETVNRFKEISDVADELAKVQMELEPGIELENLQLKKEALRKHIVLSVKNGLLAALTGGVTEEVFGVLTSRDAFVQYCRYYLNDAILRTNEISNDTRTIYSELPSKGEGLSPLMLKMYYNINKNTLIVGNNANNIDKINKDLAKIYEEEEMELGKGNLIEKEKTKKMREMREKIKKARSDKSERERLQIEQKKKEEDSEEEKVQIKKKVDISDNNNISGNDISRMYTNEDEDSTSNNSVVSSWKYSFFCCRRKPKKYRGFDGKLDGMSQEEIAFNLDNIKRSAKNSDIYIEKKILKENNIKAMVSDWFKSHYSKFLGIAEVQNSQGEFHAVKVKCIKSANGRIEIKIIDPMSASDSSSFAESENKLKDAVQSVNFKSTVSVVHEGVQDKNFGVCADLSLISISDEVCSNNKQFTSAAKQVHQYKHASNFEFILDKAKILKALLENDTKAIKGILDQYDPIYRTELLNIRNGVNGIVAARIYLKDGSYMIDSSIDNVDIAIKSNIALAEKLYENANNDKSTGVVTYFNMPDIKLEAQVAYYLKSGIAFETLRHFMDENSEHSDDYSLVNSLMLDFTDYNSNDDVSSTFQLPIMSGSIDIG